MSGLIDKLGLYLRHFETVIADTSKQTDKATLEGKRKLLTDSNVLLHCGLFVDLLDPAKKSSMFWGDPTHQLLRSKIKFVLNLLIYFFMLIFIIKIAITISTSASMDPNKWCVGSPSIHTTLFTLQQ